MRLLAFFLLTLLLASCPGRTGNTSPETLPERLAGSRRIVSPRIGKGLRTHLWVPFQLEDKYITFKSAPQLTVQVVGSGKKENGQPFHFSVKVEKARCENDGFSVTLLSADFPVREVEYVDINYLAITNCRGEACSSPPPCGSCCLH